MTWIVFDYGEVLSLPQPAADVAAMVRAAGAEPAAFERGYWAHRLEFDRGALSDEQYWSKVVGREVSGGEVSRLVALDVASWTHPHDGTVALLRELLDQGRNVALLSNAPVSMADGVDLLPWIAGIGRRFYSGRLGLVKPDREIFELMARELDAPPREIVFIDDRQLNVAGAARAGLTGLHFRDPETLRQELGALLS
ncbi:HAD family hydrolase [Nonomuraea endophytica]|uniref:Putative hydrolase of the HAD superfamily n=1 Tax=Nonomuraea endophytica TaxID=714136 RepID=A0A7W8EGJ2_9ACTN|nr:HAD family phosphatase [Nonomuraea endophytica]MBB5077607.1 putative hydrolase of the HAD superfamily [Nonomuraea endophytica]